MPQRDGLTEFIVQETIRKRKAEYEFGHYSLALNLSYCSSYDFWGKKICVAEDSFSWKKLRDFNFKKISQTMVFSKDRKSVV